MNSIENLEENLDNLKEVALPLNETAKIITLQEYVSKLRQMLDEFYQSGSDRFQLRLTEIIHMAPRTTQDIKHLITSIPNKDELQETFITLATNYWNGVPTTGISIQAIDKILVLIISVRFLFYVFKYNLITGTRITIITIMGAYVWYNVFILALTIYENALFKNKYTYQLGTDISRTIQMVKRKSASMTGQENSFKSPITFFLYLIGHGSRTSTHRIDPFSIYISSLPDIGAMEYLKNSLDNFIYDLPIWLPNSFIEWLTNWLYYGFTKLDLPQWIIDWKYHVIEYYYFIYVKLLPILVKSGVKLYGMLQPFIQYNFIVRVSKKKCPYFLRWHWTHIMFLKIIQGYPTFLVIRINSYILDVIQPKIIESQNLGLSLPREVLEAELLTNLTAVIIICQLSFYLYGLLHAICGQYFYLPIMTHNVELHIGKREKNSIYSGGFTSWQDVNPNDPNTKMQFWYGWCGTGTDKPFILFALIRKFIYRPVYKFVKVLLWPIKKIFKFINKKR